MASPPLYVTPVSAEDMARGDGELVNGFIETYCRVTKDSFGAKAGELMQLRPWQKTLGNAIYARLPTGRRKHRRALVGLPRKSGKSSGTSGYALHGLLMSGQGAEVYSAAQDKDQAKLVFGTAKRIVEMDEQLSALVKVYRDVLEVPSTGSIYKALSSEAFCVVPGTIVDLPDGQSVDIASLPPGSAIAGADGNRIVPDWVSSTARRPASPCVTVTTHRHRSVTCTRDHPFLVRLRDYHHADRLEWKAAADLAPGDRVVVGLGWHEDYKGAALRPNEAWAMGAWVGDGCNTRFRFTNIDEDVIGALDAFARTIGSSLKRAPGTIQYQLTGRGKRAKSPGREWVKEHFGAVTAHGKRVPRAVMTGTPRDWADFLAGLCDTDGHIQKRPTLTWTSVSRELLEDCRTLLARLGYNAPILSYTVPCKGERRPYFQLSLSGAAQLVRIREILNLRCAHKRERLWSFKAPSYGFRAWDSDRVTSVEDAGLRETVALSVRHTSCHITNGLITHNSKEGLNPNLVVYDELHAAPNEELYDVLNDAFGARLDPLLIAITTAGVKTDSSGGESICYRLWQYGVKICKGEVSDPTFFFAWWGAPDDADPSDPKVWEAANPSFGDLQDPADFASLYQQSEAKGTIGDYRTKRLNQWVTQAKAWLPQGAWAKCKSDRPFIVPDKGVVLGFDGSKNGDSTALVAVTIEADPKVKVLGLWEKPLDRSNDWRVPRGEVKDAIRQACRDYKVREVAADEFIWLDALEELADEGLPIVAFPQTLTRMTPATQRLYEAITTGHISHDGDPRLARHLDNAHIKTDSRGSRLQKEARNSSHKIDLAVALVMSLDRAAYWFNEPGDDTWNGHKISEIGFVWGISWLALLAPVALNILHLHAAL